MKVLAVIVTHNRRVLLERCIDHVLGQSRPADTLLVINNGSTDETEALLCARGVMHVTQTNLGSAGGWHRGLEYGLENGFDGVWLMDDDGFPDREALRRLVEAFRSEMACISSVVVCEDDPQRFVFPFPHLDGDGLPVLLRWPRKMPGVAQLRPHLHNGLYPFAHLFNGALIRTAAIAQVGNVSTEYFLYGEEVDYLFRLRAFGDVYSEIDALHYHPDVSQRRMSEAGLYYWVKNTIILNHLYFTRPVLRDMATIIVAVARLVRRNGVRDALGLTLGRRGASLARAIRLGRQGCKGRDFVVQDL